MRKFWSLMLVALVTLGAAACTETDENVDKTPEQSAGLSFYAEISNDATRADLEYDADNKVWNTVWEGNETLIVTCYGDNDETTDYRFSNSETEKNKFTCTDDGVETIIGKVVTISNEDSIYSTSRSGKKTLFVHNFIDEFSVEEPIKLTSEISFLRYTYNGEGSVTLNVSFNNGDQDVNVFYEEDDNGMFGESVSEITFDGIQGENWVAVWPHIQSGSDYSATLSYSIDGVKCKEATINGFGYGKVYNLGTLTEPEVEMATIYFSPGVWNVDGAWFSAHVWNTSEAIDVKLTDEDADGIYECEVPADMTNVIFCRMNPAFTEFAWNEEGATEENLHVWNQTADLEIGIAPNNYYYITDWETGIWSTKDGYELPERNIGVIGFGGNWDTDIDMTLEDGWYTLKGKEISATDSFKVRLNDAWNESYGVESAEENNAINAGEIYTLVAGGKNMMVPAGIYDLYFNDATKQFKAEKVDDIEVPENVDLGIAGSFQGWNAANPIAMTASNDGWYVATGIEMYKSDEFKFVVDKSWSVSYGGSAAFVADVDTEYTLQSNNSQNIKVSKNGVFTIYFNYTTKTFKYECTEEYTNLMVDITINNKANWNPLYITLKNGDTVVVENAAVTNNVYSISGNYIGESLSYVLSNGTKTLDGNISITKEGATINLEETIIKLTVQLNTANAKQWWGSTMKIHVWSTGTSFDTSWPGTTMTSEGNYTWSIVVPSELVGKQINYLVHNGNGWQSADSKVTIKAEGNTITGSSIGIN